MTVMPPGVVVGPRTPDAPCWLILDPDKALYVTVHHHTLELAKGCAAMLAESNGWPVVTLICLPRCTHSIPSGAHMWELWRLDRPKSQSQPEAT